MQWFSGARGGLQPPRPGFKSQVCTLSILFFYKCSYAAFVVGYMIYHHHPDVHVLSGIRSKGQDSKNTLCLSQRTIWNLGKSVNFNA